MANSLYDRGRDAFANAGINWVSDTIKVALINTASYTVNLATHQYYSDLGAGVFGTPITLATKSTSAGVVTAGNVSFTGLTSAPAIGAIVIYKDTGVGTTSPLIAYIDTATGLPVAAGATQIDITWDTGTNKIFKL